MKIALMGKMRSGKDTVGEFLECDRGFVGYALADELKRMAKKAYPEMFYNGEKPRELLQNLGAHMRKFDEDYWVNVLLSKIADYNVVYVDTGKAVITDVRFPNEAEALKKEGFKIIRVASPEKDRFQRCIEAGDLHPEITSQHESETACDFVVPDATIVNDGTIEELYAKVDQVMEVLNDI